MADYEYGAIIRTVELRPGLPDMSGDEVSQAVLPGFNKTLQEAAKACELQEGNWEIMSHALTRVDRYMIATFVIRHPK